MLQISEYLLPLDFNLDRQDINIDLPNGSKILPHTFCYDQRRIFYEHNSQNGNRKEKHTFYLLKNGKPATKDISSYDHFKTFDAANATFHLFKLKT